MEKRITYYMARLISSQKETEFFHSGYDNIKKIYSIWLCMECASDAIYEVRLTPKNIYGIVEDPMKFDKMSAVIVQLRNQKSRNESKNQLIAMLEDLLQDEESTIKKQKLQEKYNLKMTVELERRLADMCNLSDLIEERGIERGIEQGIEVFVLDNLEENVTKDRIIEKMQRRFQLTESQAIAYFDQYSVKMVGV